MKSLVVLALFVGIFLITSGIYEQRIEEARKDKKIEYRFIPRTYYDEQLGDSKDLASMFNNMFEGGNQLDYTLFKGGATKPKSPIEQKRM